ncbi:MAG: 4-hydroxy-2-oxoheptanedioate aldolase [Bacillota bacterium]|nr:4-hydroxy-2-oxoheptanedioate aldolase [Bacillota bacterium]
MPYENKLKKALAQGRTVFGPFMKLSDPAVVEVFGYAGFDFVIIDTEHGPLSIETAENLVRAAQLTGVTPIIRVTDNDPAKISRALDIGAQGVQVPQITSREEAEKAVRAAKFAPQGDRGVCRFVRAADYTALDRYKYFLHANENTLVIIMVEGLEGISNIDGILATPGIDILFVGPYDLSQSLGVTGQVNHPSVIAKLEEVTAKAREKGVVVGTFVDTVEAAHQWSKLGIQYISYSVDVGLLYEGSRQIVSALKDEIQRG